MGQPLSHIHRMQALGMLALDDNKFGFHAPRTTSSYVQLSNQTTRAVPGVDTGQFMCEIGPSLRSQAYGFPSGETAGYRRNNNTFRHRERISRCISAP